MQTKKIEFQKLQAFEIYVQRKSLTFSLELYKLQINTQRTENYNDYKEI